MLPNSPFRKSLLSYLTGKEEEEKALKGFALFKGHLLLLLLLLLLKLWLGLLEIR